MEENTLVEKIRGQLTRNSQLPYYAHRFKNIGLKVKDIRTITDFRNIPLMNTEDLVQSHEEFPPLGSMCHPDTVRVNISPGPKGFLPVTFTQRDIQEVAQTNAGSLRSTGITEHDVVAITFGYHLFIAGLLTQGGFEAVGCKTIPLGPGDAERAAELINRFGVTVLASNPSFAIRLAEAGVKELKMLYAGGEAFSSVPGYKERVRNLYGDIRLIDGYGLAHAAPVARECTEESGMHVLEDIVYLEIIDPETENVLTEGEEGEIVITHLSKESSPLLRFRTGDLSVFEYIDCPCGRSATLPYGVRGSAREMYKVKGVKLYPTQIGLIVKSFQELTGKYRIVISSKGGTDRLKILLEAIKGQSISEQAFRERVKQAILIRPEKIEIIESLEEGPLVIDERFAGKVM